MGHPSDAAAVACFGHFFFLFWVLMAVAAECGFPSPCRQPSPRCLRCSSPSLGQMTAVRPPPSPLLPPSAEPPLPLRRIRPRLFPQWHSPCEAAKTPRAMRCLRRLWAGCIVYAPVSPPVSCCCALRFSMPNTPAPTCPNGRSPVRTA